MGSYVQQQRSYTPDPYARGRTTPTLQPQQPQPYQPQYQYPYQQQQQPQQYYASTPPPMQRTPPPPMQRTPPPPLRSEYDSPYLPQTPYQGSAEDYGGPVGTPNTLNGFFNTSSSGGGGGGRRRDVALDNDDESIQPIVTSTDANGFEYRHPEYGRVIPQAEILNRIVPFWETIVTTAGILSHHLLTKAEDAIAQPNPRNVFLFGACKSENRQSDVDLCTVSAVFWTLTIGVVIYFVIATIFAIAIGIEIKRKGYPALFTMLWNSPWFIFCYLFGETKRIDLLTIPNRVVGFAFFTRAHIHRLVLVLWTLITAILIGYSLTKRTVDSSDMDANKKYAESDFKKIYNFYNPYLIPYYVAIYLLVKASCVALSEIYTHANHDRPKLVAVNYVALRK